MEKLQENKLESSWYILRASGNKERSVGEKLRKESEVGDLMGKLDRVIVPVETSFYMKNGKKVKREKVKFPGYIFLKTNSVAELKYFIRGVNGASGFLTNRGGDILALSQTEVDRMIDDHESSKESSSMESDINKYIFGEEIIILEGPFSSMDGKVECVNGDKVKVSISIFGRVTNVELGILQIDRKEK